MTFRRAHDPLHGVPSRSLGHRTHARHQHWLRKQAARISLGCCPRKGERLAVCLGGCDVTRRDSSNTQHLPNVSLSECIGELGRTGLALYLYYRSADLGAPARSCRGVSMAMGCTAGNNLRLTPVYHSPRLCPVRGGHRWLCPPSRQTQPHSVSQRMVPRAVINPHGSASCCFLGYPSDQLQHKSTYSHDTALCRRHRNGRAAARLQRPAAGTGAGSLQSEERDGDLPLDPDSQDEATGASPPRRCWHL